MTDVTQLDPDLAERCEFSGQDGTDWTHGQRMLFMLGAVSGSWGLLFLAGYVIYWLL